MPNIIKNVPGNVWPPQLAIFTVYAKFQAKPNKSELQYQFIH